MAKPSGSIFAVSLFLALPVLSGAQPGSLLSAAKSGQANLVMSLIREGGDVNEAETDGTTVLHWAVQNNLLDSVKNLLAGGATVNAANHYGVTPLALAIRNNNAEIFDTLIAAGADVHATPPETGSLLLMAARVGNPNMVRVLLHAGVNVNEPDPMDGQTALMWAAAQSNAEIVRILLDEGANVKALSRAHHTALFLAVRRGDLESVRALIKADADVNERPPFPQEDLRCEDVSCGKFPIGYEMNRSAFADDLLVLAIRNGHFDVADLLLNNGADPNVQGTRWTPLHMLERLRNYEKTDFPPPVLTNEKVDGLELARHLIAKGADVNAPALTNYEMRDGQDENYIEFKGATPILFAAKAADIPMMKLLLSAGAKISTKAEDGTTPLLVAAGVGCVPGQWLEPESDVLTTVKLLVEELKVDVNETNERHETALHGAVCRGADTVIQYLLDKGAKLDAKDIKGRTPFDWAAKGIDEPVTPHGADIITFRFSEHTKQLMATLTGSRGKEPNGLTGPER